MPKRKIKKAKTVKKRAIKKSKPVEKVSRAAKTAKAKRIKKKRKLVKVSIKKNERKVKKEAGADYEAKHIQVLEGLSPVRKRPGMFIGGTGTEGLHHLIWEVVDNAIDEAMAGFCSEIEVTLLEDNKIKVSDNGRGIPVEKHPQTKKSALETVLTILHAGGKFGGGGYKVAGGLHGVGVSVVNALSSWMKAEVIRNAKIYVQEYSQGKPLGKVKLIGRSKDKKSGTTIIFQPDSEIFPEIKFNWKTILDHLRQQAYLTKGLKIKIIDQRDSKGNSYTFCFQGGIVSYIKYLARGKEVKNKIPFYLEKKADNIEAEIALQYVDGFKEHIFAFANNIYNLEGGTHLTGFKSALTRSINDYARREGFIKEKEENLTADDIREGLVGVISVKLKNPQFEGQTKTKLGNTEVRGIVASMVYDSFNEYLETYPSEAREIIGKCLLSAKARLAARAARTAIIRKGALEGMTLPGKLADCSTKDRENSELYIVEGDSAGGSAKQGRDRTFQAILPLRGKILNVERARIDRILSSQEIKTLIVALGTGIKNQFDLSKLRYGRIIIMTDADVDGAHITTLLLTLFYRYFEPLIQRGHLFVAQAPLYRIQKGKLVRYAYTDRDKEEILSEFKKTKGSEGINIQHYKGLGEMNPSQLWETTMDPKNRIMKQITIQDAEKAEAVFETLMGSEVAPRKKFIQIHAKRVRNLDI